MGQQPYQPRPDDVRTAEEAGGAPFGNTSEPRRGPQPMGFPFPGVSGTTKGGTRYYVGGCCLPLPLGCLTVLTMAGGAALVSKLRAR